MKEPDKDWKKKVKGNDYDNDCSKSKRKGIDSKSKSPPLPLKQDGVPSHADFIRQDDQEGDSSTSKVAVAGTVARAVANDAPWLPS